ncbi:MAG: hypothetical protein AAF483_21200 [Planctomycetota bacterium]
MGTRDRKKRLRKKMLERIVQDPSQLEQYQKRKWTRRWHRIGMNVILLLAFVGFVFAAFGAMIMGLVLNGPVEVGQWLGTREKFKPTMAPVLAGWTILCTAGLLANALRIRQSAISLRYRPWATNLPVSDVRLISPIQTGVGLLACAFFFMGLAAFGIPAWVENWGFGQCLRVVVMVVLTTASAWLLSDLLAAYLPLSTMLQSVTLAVVVLAFIAGVGFAVVPRHVLEVRAFSSFEAIWVLPPAGWYVGILGYWPNDWGRSFGRPFLGVVLTTLAGWHLLRTLELRDIQMTTGIYQSAFRKGWLRSWSRPNRVSGFADAAMDSEKACRSLREMREERLGTEKRHWLLRLAFPLRLSSEQLAILGLLGLRYPRFGRWAEFLVGMWPVPFCIGLLILNQFMTLQAMPRFLRMPLMFSFALSLVNFREFAAAQNKGDMSIGFSAVRSVFPISNWHVFYALFWNRVCYGWGLLPGWSLAICFLFLTDSPVDIVVQIPLILLAVNFLIPVYTSTTFLSGNLRSCWQTWVLVIAPWTLLTIVAFITFQFGVAGYMLAWRFDLAWQFMLVVAGLLVLGALLFRGAVRWCSIDETTHALARSLKKF